MSAETVYYPGVLQKAKNVLLSLSPIQKVREALPLPRTETISFTPEDQQTQALVGWLEGKSSAPKGSDEKGILLTLPGAPIDATPEANERIEKKLSEAGEIFSHSKNW